MDTAAPTLMDIGSRVEQEVSCIVWQTSQSSALSSWTCGGSLLLGLALRKFLYIDSVRRFFMLNFHYLISFHGQIRKK